MGKPSVLCLLDFSLSYLKDYSLPYSQDFSKIMLVMYFTLNFYGNQYHARKISISIFCL